TKNAFVSLLCRRLGGGILGREGSTFRILSKNRSGQVGAQQPEEKEFADLFDSSGFGQVFAETAFGQKIRKEGRDLGLDLFRLDDKVAIFVIEAEAQYSTVICSDVVVVEDEEILIVWEVRNRTDTSLVQPDFEDSGIFSIRFRHRFPPVRCRGAAEGWRSRQSRFLPVASRPN